MPPPAGRGPRVVTTGAAALSLCGPRWAPSRAVPGEGFSRAILCERRGRSTHAGSAIIVSHDRWFLDRVCTHTLAFEAGGKVEFFEGSVSQYAAWAAKYRKGGSG